MLADLNHAVRGLRKSPALAAIAIASLALGIGANVTVYSVVREMILDDLSARQPDRLVRVDLQVDYGQYRELRDAGEFQDLAFDTGIDGSNWNLGKYSEIIWGMTTSANFFDALVVGPSLGRLYAQSDDGFPVAVASYGFWHQRLHADPNAVGRPLEFDGQLYTLLGVLPRDYLSVMGHGLSPEVYFPGHRGLRNLRAFGRLRDGLSRTQTHQAVAAAAQTIGGEDFVKKFTGLRPMAGLAASAAGDGDDRRFFIFFVMLFGTASILALIACFNVAGLLLARGVTRQRELAIRKALGANRFQITRQLLAEGFVLVALGAFAGLIVDAFLRNWLRYVRWPSAYNLPFEFHFQNDRGLFLYALASALAAVLVSSLIPSLRGSNANIGLAMRQGEPAFSIRRWDLRNSFVAIQVALAMVLLTLGVLFLRSFVQVARVDPGFDISHTLIAQVYWLPEQHRDDKGWSWRDGIVRRLKEVPGVMGVTSIAILPLMGELSRDSVRRKEDASSTARDVYSQGAGEEFCKVLGIPILRGRDFEIADRDRHPEPALVTRTLARQMFGDDNPIGAQLVVGHEKERVVEIVGVTADVRMRSLGESGIPLFFTPFAQAQLLVRVAGNSAQWTKPLRDALSGADTISTLDVRPLSDAAAGAIFPMRVAAGFLGSMSALGLLLALAGLYSSVSYATRRRTREMAIRAAIGATRSRILWTAIRDGMAVLIVGVAAGLPLGFAAIRPLTDILPDGVDRWNPVMFSAIGLLLLATGIGAAWIPAQGAANVDPSVALRQE